MVEKRVKKTEPEVQFSVSISGRNNGTLECAYIQVKEGKVAKTLELRTNALLVDLDAKGETLGFEILSPVRLSEFKGRVQKAYTRSFNRFVKCSLPQELVST